MRNPPAHYEKIAETAEAEGRWQDASKAWMDAKGASLGHGRRDRYEAQALRCHNKAMEICADVLNA